MQQALTSPVVRSVALAGLLLAATVTVVGMGSSHKRRLVLHTVSRPCAVYLTAWRNGDVVIEDEGALKPLTIRTRAWLSDGCRWQATETLTPISETRYAYRYDEKILRCEPDADPYIQTPRRGYVDVFE